MYDSYIDLVKMIWNEMNPAEGYTYDMMNNHYINHVKNKQVPNIWDLKHRLVFQNNINDIIEATDNFRDKINGDWKWHYLGKPQKVNYPKNYSEMFDDFNTEDMKRVYRKSGLVEEDYIKPINNNIDKIKNRIPNVSLGKIVNKILSEPAVKIGGKVLGKVLEPLAILDGLGLNNPAY